MLRRVFLALLVLAAGCANGGNPQVDPCERAFERLVDECGFEISGTDGVELHCTGASACFANCLELSSCGDVAGNKGEFSECTSKCD